jgi:hypothetical protein
LPELCQHLPENGGDVRGHSFVTESATRQMNAGLHVTENVTLPWERFDLPSIFIGSENTRPLRNGPSVTVLFRDAGQFQPKGEQDESKDEESQRCHDGESTPC